MRGKAWRWAGAIGVAALVATACDGDDNGAGGGGAGGSEPVTYGTSDCGSCVHDSCAAAIQGCGTDPECATYLSCLDACPLGEQGDVDPICERECPRGSGSTAQDAIDLVTICRTTGPGASCAACGQQAPSGNAILNQDCPTSPETNPCYKCEDEHCCETYAAYAEVPEAVAYKECLQDCLNTGGEGCYSQCYEQHPEGVQQFAPRFACIQVYCIGADQCGGGIEPDPCTLCVNQHCAEPWADLVGDPVGYLLWTCTTECPSDQTCWEGCQTTFPTAVPLWEAFTACALTQCTAECS